MRAARRKAALALAALAAAATCAPERGGELAVQFIKGDILDKTAAIREADGDDKAVLAALGLDFMDAHGALLHDDRDFSALGAATLLSLPDGADDGGELFGKLVSVYGKCPDANVRTIILGKLPAFAAGKAERAAVRRLAHDVIEPGGDGPASLARKAFEALGKIGNEESLALVLERYTAPDGSRPAQCADEMEGALVALMLAYPEEALMLISSLETSKISKIVGLAEKSPEITKNYQMDIAETALSLALYDREHRQDDSEENARLRLRLVERIAEEKWARATELVAENFIAARKEHEARTISEDDFVRTIRATAALKSSKISSALSECLARFNGAVGEARRPSEHVVLALINSLGDLGDKAAFDNLLYVTYLDYSDEVVNAARDALASLKW